MQRKRRGPLHVPSLTLYRTSTCKRLFRVCGRSLFSAFRWIAGNAWPVGIIAGTAASLLVWWITSALTIHH